MNNKKVLLEICSGNFQSAINAQLAGADRVELCENLPAGGTTPSHGLIAQTKSRLQIPLFVLIRPRPGNFTYDENEIAIIENDIEICKNLKVDGVVVGMLDKHGNVPVEIVGRWVELARPMQVTFHKAFDYCLSPEQEIAILAKIGVSRILTSGGKPSVNLGKEKIKQWMKTAEQSNIVIMPGGGVTEQNVKGLVEYLDAREIHGSFKERRPEFESDLSMGVIEISSVEKIAKAVAEISSLKLSSFN
jgi:copper homeostasis protein